MEKTISQAEMMQLLDKLYEQAVNGIGKVSPPLDELAQNYLEKNKDVETAAKKFIQYQVIKCTIRFLKWIRRGYYSARNYSGECGKCIVCSDEDDCLFGLYGRI